MIMMTALIRISRKTPRLFTSHNTLCHLHHVFKHFPYYDTLFSNFHLVSSVLSGVFLHLSRVQACRLWISRNTWSNWTQSFLQFYAYFTDQCLSCYKFDSITPFSVREIFFLSSFFSPESSCPTVFSVSPGNHAFVSFLGYSADIPCHILCSDRAVGKWEALLLIEKTHQVAWPLNIEKKNEKSLKKTNSSSTSFSCKTEALHSGSLIVSKASWGLLSSPRWSWRSFCNLPLHSMAKRRSRITYAPKSRRKSSGSDRNQSAPVPGSDLKENVSRSKRASASRSSSSHNAGLIPREEVSCKYM